MSKPRVIDALPTLNQADFPSLPKMPEDCVVLLPYGTRMQKLEKEIVLGILITAAVQAGSWCAVSTTTFASLLEAGFTRGGWPNPEIRDLWSNFWSMQKDGLIDVVEMSGAQYVIPTPEVAAMATNFAA